MLIAQDLILVASDADRTGLQLGSPQMLIAHDLILVASNADRTGLTCFASNADCTGLTLVTSVWTYRRLTIWLRFEVL